MNNFNTMKSKYYDYFMCSCTHYLNVIFVYKFKYDFGSKVGKILSTIMITLIIVNSLFFTAIF